MDKDTLWQTFAHSGRVEDYLRYRGIDLTAGVTACVQEEVSYGDRPKTASDDRRSDSERV